MDSYDMLMKLCDNPKVYKILNRDIAVLIVAFIRNVDRIQDRDLISKHSNET